MQEMSQTDLKEIQAVTLTMSKYFVQFCQENTQSRIYSVG